MYFPIPLSFNSLFLSSMLLCARLLHCSDYCVLQKHCIVCIYHTDLSISQLALCYYIQCLDDVFSSVLVFILMFSRFSRIYIKEQAIVPLCICILTSSNTFPNGFINTFLPLPEKLFFAQSIFDVCCYPIFVFFCRYCVGSN